VFIAVLLAFIQVSGEIHLRRTERFVANAKIDFAESLNRSARPLVILLGRIAEKQSRQEREELANTLIALAVNIAATECGRLSGADSQTRSAFYRFNNDGQALDREAWTGRSATPPRSRFDAARGENDRQVIGLARGEDALLINDITSEPEFVFDGLTGRTYQSFVMAPVRTDSKIFGFISVDADRPYTFTSTDVGYITLLAGVIATALTLAETASGAELRRIRPALDDPSVHGHRRATA
jgi:GAF domain-containing protein